MSNLPITPVVILIMGALVLGFSVGDCRSSEAARKHWDQDLRERENGCLCGQVQTCPFGPGIVGEQRCRTAPSMRNEWTRCEPASEVRQ